MSHNIYKDKFEHEKVIGQDDIYYLKSNKSIYVHVSTQVHLVGENCVMKLNNDKSLTFLGYGKTLNDAFKKRSRLTTKVNQKRARSMPLLVVLKLLVLLMATHGLIVRSNLNMTR